jgi:hypothetical protein
MAQTGKLIVLAAYSKTDDGDLLPAFEPRQIETEEKAMRIARTMAGEYAGVIAWSRDADIALGCQRRSKNRPRGGAKVGHCGAGLRPPGGLKPERGSRAGVAIFREVFSLPFGRGFGRDDSCRRSSRGC